MLDSELRELSRALRCVVVVETTGAGEYTEDGRLEAPVRIINPATAEETVAEFGGVDTSRAPQAGEQYVALMIGGRLAECIAIRRLGRPGDIQETEPGVYVVQPPEGENVRIVVKGGGKVVIDAADIRLGSDDASMAVALAPLVEQILQQRDATFGGHTHTYVAPLFSIGPAPTTPPAPGALGTGKMGADKVTGE